MRSPLLKLLEPWLVVLSCNGTEVFGVNTLRPCDGDLGLSFDWLPILTSVGLARICGLIDADIGLFSLCGVGACLASEPLTYLCSLLFLIR